MNERPIGPIRHKDGRVLGQHRGLLFIRSASGKDWEFLWDIHFMWWGWRQRPIRWSWVRNRTFTRSKSRCGRYPGCRGTPTLPLKMSVKIRSKHTEASAVVTPAKRGPVKV